MQILQEIDEIGYPIGEIGCGLENIGITDRYEAAAYGWGEAVGRITEIIRSHMIEELVSNPDKWIPLEKNAVLPEQNQTVDITFRNSAGIHVGEATYKGGSFYYVVDTMDCYCEEEYTDVLAWRERPVPYQPKEEKRK